MCTQRLSTAYNGEWSEGRVQRETLSNHSSACSAACVHVLRHLSLGSMTNFLELLRRAGKFRGEGAMWSAFSWSLPARFLSTLRYSSASSRQGDLRIHSDACRVGLARLSETYAERVTHPHALPNTLPGPSTVAGRVGGCTNEGKTEGIGR